MSDKKTDDRNPYDKARIEQLEAQVKELEKQRHNLSEELAPHKEREWKEKDRIDNEKRATERDQKIFDNIVRIETLVTKAVKDPLLKRVTFEYALSSSMSMGAFRPFYYMR